MKNCRLKVLVLAYACNPYKGSEEGVGWGWVKAISRHHDLSVITADFHRADIEKAFSEEKELSSRLKFCYVPHKHWHYAPTKGWEFIEASCLKPIMNYAYILWQKDAFKLGTKLHNEIGFDLFHQITYVGFRFPGRLWKLDVPFVWGPIGGLENTPWRFLLDMGLYGCIYYAERNIINSLHRRFLLAPKQAFRKANGGIIAATEGIRREILRWYRQESEVICEIGPPPGVVHNYSIRRHGDVLKLAWSGLHLPRKALPLLLHSLARLPVEVVWQLNILGTGTCSEKWKRLAKKIGIYEKCSWHGQLPRADAIALVHQSHIFIITSMEDLTSTVLLEAISQGVPVVCPDHCGFSDVVNADCGIKVPVKTPQQFVSDLAIAIMNLADDEQKRRQLAKGALERIKEFSWEKKAEKVDSIYRRVVNK